ncbi:MAG TPA: proline--tRNA ligase [Rhabdochlamydiaceae bacterium]|nr:proline--tRNA ligase [Rhabdochlamydiaceae bacterium]
MKSAISPKRDENYPEWYQEVMKAADLAEHSAVRGCMVIKPWGYSIWENMQKTLDQKFKATGHQNAYFPLFIPLSYLQKEAEHVEGFAKECAVVTHHRLETKDGKLVPAGPLEEPLIVRPTSETIIGESFSKWITSYRDLPLLINQWCNVVRWEMRTRLFLRTTEFLWQEGHTAHATAEEALEETMRMLNVYEEFARKTLAIPVIRGEKTPTERFPGAVSTYCIEAMMQDRKALQMGTSHFLGQNFAKSSDIKFQDQNGEMAYAWTTSWGVTTRMIGALIMTHSDDDGLVLPPKIASAHIVIIPIIHKEETRAEVLGCCHSLAGELRHVLFDGKPLTVIVDERDLRSGEKTWNWIKKGVPVRIEVGPRDIESGSFPVARRDKPHKETTPLSRGHLVAKIADVLEDIQNSLYQKALTYRNSHIKKIDRKEDFYAYFTPISKDQPEIHGGFASAHWCGDPAMEEQLKNDLSVTVRCIPIDGEVEEGTCPFTGKKSAQRVIYAKSY